MTNTLEFGIAANQSIIAFVLPKWLASEPQHSVALSGREPLERLHHLGDGLHWSDQEMNVVGHYDKRVEMKAPLISIVNGIHHHLRDRGHE